VNFTGDWARHIDAHSAGWSFEYTNDWYPDIDDTAMVAMALARTGTEPAHRSAAQRGINWLLALQNEDGGWAAFDRTRDRPMLECVPFADHNAIQDPSCADITGRVLESLAWNGFDLSHPSVERAIQFLKRTQQPDGTWFGRWGVNYIYGTWQAIGGLARIGVDMSEPWIRRAGAWLKSVQKSDGSFGESANSYIDPKLKGTGPATASQTAWATMTLMDMYGADDPCVERAINWLCDMQVHSWTNAPDGFTDPLGSWHETEYTGTGFPRVYYLRYHLYRLYFPLMALARFVRGTT
jgi:squalene-hopene/tetraprenyl-beta-curcumene cyclase